MQLSFRLLAATSFCCFLLAFCGLLILEEGLPLPITVLSELENKRVGTVVAVQVLVKEVREHDTIAFFTLEQGNVSLAAVWFDYDFIPLEKEYCVIGKVARYKGKLEIIVHQLQECERY